MCERLISLQLNLLSLLALWRKEWNGLQNSRFCVLFTVLGHSFQFGSVSFWKSTVEGDANFNKPLFYVKKRTVNLKILANNIRDINMSFWQILTERIDFPIVVNKKMHLFYFIYKYKKI